MDKVLWVGWFFFWIDMGVLRKDIGELARNG